MSYKVTFHTEAYKSHRASKKNWELGTQNDHIKALNGLPFVEETKEELSWRLLMAGGNTPYELTPESTVRYEAWRNNPRNTIKFRISCATWSVPSTRQSRALLRAMSMLTQSSKR